MIIAASWVICAGTLWGASLTNDEFSGATPLFGAQGVIVVSNVDASKEIFEPDHAGNVGGHSVWCRFHANCGGRMRLDPSHSSFPVVLAVYLGAGLDSLSAVASAVNQPVEFSLVPGAIYQIAIDGSDGAVGDLSLGWSQIFLPGGGPDLVILTNSIQPVVITRAFEAGDCQIGNGCTREGARQLLRFAVETLNQGNEDIVIGSTSGSPLFEYNACNDYDQFRYYAQFRLLNGTGQIVATNSKFGFCLEDSRRQFATGSESARYDCRYQGLQAGWSDLYGVNLACQFMDVTAVPPGQYALEVHINPLSRLVEVNYSNNVAVLPVLIDPPCTKAPLNDGFAAPIVLTGESITVVGDNRCSSKQTGETTHGNNPGGRSIWYRWTAPYSGPVTISLLGSTFDTLLAVYSGSTLANLATTLVEENDDFSAEIAQSQVTFSAAAGTTYRIAVDGYNWGEDADSGQSVLWINPAHNDSFVSAQVITSSIGSVFGYNRTATLEVGEPLHGGNLGGHSVWFRWTAPKSGSVTFDTVGSRFDTILAAYTGDRLADLTLLAQAVSVPGAALSRIRFNVRSGTTCSVAVDGREGTSGLCSLNWSMSGTLSITRLPDETLEITFDASTGENCSLEDSVDLFEWSSVVTLLNQSGRVQFPPQPATATRRFYRVVTTPAP